MLRAKEKNNKGRWAEGDTFICEKLVLQRYDLT